MLGLETSRQYQALFGALQENLENLVEKVINLSL